MAGPRSTGRRPESQRPGGAAARPGDVVGLPRRVGWEVGANSRRQPRVPCGHHWLTGRGALRYSLAVRARPRAVRVPRDPFGGGTAPSTYDLTK
jgi:hypothetical protein